jgi:hypothetical protein
LERQRHDDAQGEGRFGQKAVAAAATTTTIKINKPPIGTSTLLLFVTHQLQLQQQVLVLVAPTLSSGSYLGGSPCNNSNNKQNNS